MALDGTRVADASCVVGFGKIRGRGIAGEAGKKHLTELSNCLCAILKFLYERVSKCECISFDCAHIWESFARISLELKLAVNESGTMSASFEATHNEDM